MFSKLSFRQLLLGVFLLIAGLLSAASLHALWTLDRLAAHSRDSGRHAIALTQNVQLLAERSVAMARSARQFQVLDDPAFRSRYADAWRDAGVALDAVASGLPRAPAAHFADWRRHSDEAWAILQAQQAGRRNVRQAALTRALAPLPAINEELADEVKREVDRRNGELLAELEQRRGVLTGQVLASIGLAALLAGGFGLWLARPLAQIETAIDRLGENRFDHAIDVRGPSDLRRVGQQLNWLRQRLADLEADKERFLRHISHELKTPLAALREGVALLEDGVAGTLSPDQREIAGILSQNTASLQTQIEALLRYNAATFDAHHLQRQSTDPAALLREVIASQRLQWQAGGLSVDVAGEARAIALDPDKLAVALGNLLSNAVRFSPPGGAIHFTLLKTGGRLRIDCIDDGPGVAPGDSAHIFEPFYQGVRQPAGARRGNGIGLSIVHEYIAAHGGTLQLLPTSSGAHFRIEIPYEI
ncbi:HAMP domain-containing protein [Oxalobacteraceae bacterium]|nr:HAMP domain-containing protein [Oxalobacteraceae bacterium]